MKKLTLSIGLVAAIMSAKAQDTLCTFFTGKEVYEFNYYTDSILWWDNHSDEFYTVEVGHKQVLALHLCDTIGFRKIITTYPDGTVYTHTLDSQDYVYYSRFGPLKVQVGKPKLIILQSNTN